MNWVAFCKKPFKSPEHVIKYLGQYSHRVASNNSRIKSFDGKSVRFSWKDYLQHVLPNVFVKIHYYGLLCSGNILTKLLKCMILTGSKPPKTKGKIPKKLEPVPIVTVFLF
ncbi:MAG: transposase [Eubacteriales bacterium]